MDSGLYGVLGNAIVWGLLIPIIAIRFSVKSAPELWPILVLGFLGEAVLAFMLFKWWLGGFFVLMFVAHLASYARMYRRYQIIRAVAPWNEVSAPQPNQAIEARPAGYHRPDVVAQRTGEFPQVNSKS